MINIERQSILNSEIAAAASQAEVIAAFRRVMHEFSFRYFMLIDSSRQTEDTNLARRTVGSNVPVSYIRQFDKQNLISRCPAARIIAETSVPLVWCHDDPEGSGGFTFPAEIRSLQKSHDMITGLAMGSRSPDGVLYSIFMSGPRPRLSQAEINELGMILLHAFSMFHKVRSHGTISVAMPLSTRELEVVRWTSQGKTSAEIGRILDLSDHTVNAYMTNAIKKMDCVNRTQLVAKALRMRLIA